MTKDVMMVVSVLCLTVGLAAAFGGDEEKAAPSPATNSEASKEIPAIVRDESAGDWVVDRFVGNSTAGLIFLQGQALEAGGVGRNFYLAVAPDGRVFVPLSSLRCISGGIAEVSTDGIVRLVISRQEWGVDGLDDFSYRSGLLAWNPKENALYMWGKNCIRRLVEKPDGSHSLEVVVGTPGKPGLDDGPVQKATLTSIGNISINSRGTVFFYDGAKSYGSCLRKLENGVVTTLNRNMRSGKHVDGPLDEACFNFINLGGLNSIGENDDVLYIGDHWNGVVRRIDLKAGQVTTVAGWVMSKKPGPKPSPGDGPALTQASFCSGCTFGVYDPVHKAVWCGGPDETRLRWVKFKDGWVKTVMGSKSVSYWARGWDPDGIDQPADAVGMGWCWVLAVDTQGRAYVMDGYRPTGYWRLYNKKEISR